MSGLLEWITGRPTRPVTLQLTTKVVGPAAPIVVRRRAVTTIVPPPRSAWDEKRWRVERQDGARHYIGAYRVFDRRCGWRAFDGRIIDGHGEIAAYCADPLPEIRNHRHGPCFQLARSPWFKLHWSDPPEHVDEAILYVEGILDEAINGA